MRLLTIEQAAEMLAVHPNTVRGMLAKLGAVDLKGGRGKNRLSRIPEEGITAYLRTCAIRTPAQLRELAPAPTTATFRLERRRA